VQRPALRDDTLARDRLLDWLSARIHDRVILVLADAGYGKTTLLADFSRRTRLRTLWYRLEEDDRDWIAFLNHLVAAGREHDPDFAPTTSAMLADMSVSGPTRDAAIDVFLRELPGITDQGAILILDDFHLVDDSPDVRLIARELVARAPERLSIVFASRRVPTIPLARLRAAGEVAELGTDDLRFDADETHRLFSETYGRRLEPDVLADVVARTEGWAASLQLVDAALRDRTPAEIRRFVRDMSGADQELYDYLAEEVVGDLPEDLQHFLMRTAILQTVTAELAAVVTGLDAQETNRLTLAAERLTLLTRRSRTSLAPQRYHPLVREFLEARLRLTAGDAAVAAMHRRVATAATSIDWRIAAHHYSEAGDEDEVATVVANALPQIMGSGQYGTADMFFDQAPLESLSPAVKLIKARIELQRGEYGQALALSDEVLNVVVPGSPESDHALLNLVTTKLHAGDSRKAVAYAGRLRQTSNNEQLRLIADGTALLVESSSEGNLETLARQLLAMASTQRGTHPHYFGVSMLNLSIISILRDDLANTVDYADSAIEALRETSSKIEYSSAVMTKGIALTMLGEFDRARTDLDLASTLGQTEATLERANLDDSFGDPTGTRARLEVFEPASMNGSDRIALSLQWARYYSRRGNHELARSRMNDIPSEIVGLYPGQSTEHLATLACIAVASGSQDGPATALAAYGAAKKQGAHRWRRVAAVLRACGQDALTLSSTVASVGEESPWNLTYLADILVQRLDVLNDDGLAGITRAAALHPRRWRFVLRSHVSSSAPGAGLAAARMLEAIGERADIRLLRSYARNQRRMSGASTVGRALSRRLATPVFVEDQNRVAIRVGERLVAGTSIRRKVLALLCFLLTKPELASTRDQVLDALWPDLDPLDAVNSLNQTVYFLRRVLEEDYVDDLSPGYLHHDSDLIWLDRDLVRSRCNDCRRLVRAMPISPSPDAVADLVDQYAGRFALDFEYEEWAAPFRDWLHAAVLEIVERAVTEDLATGHFERGIRLARRILDIDPNAEQIEVSLLRLYRASGAHAAAAEQYGHYAGVMRDQLGIDPPTLESL
jgi:LuxR family maltose regulon positive regulatory protein